MRGGGWVGGDGVVVGGRGRGVGCQGVSLEHAGRRPSRVAGDGWGEKWGGEEGGGVWKGQVKGWERGAGGQTEPGCTYSNAFSQIDGSKGKKWRDSRKSRSGLGKEREGEGGLECVSLL